MVTYINKKYEIDIYIEDINIGIEYDGEAYHGVNKIHNDERKNYILKKVDINLIRVREEKCPHINLHGQYLIICPTSSNSDYKYLNNTIEEVLSLITKKFEIDCCVLERIERIDIDIMNDKNKIYASYLRRQKESSLLIKYPELAQQWHPIASNV